MKGIVFVVVALVLELASPGEATTTPNLRLVSVVFRHGDRAPDNNGKELYPNDPYLNFEFYPMGLGGLTNEGKMREYSLGKALRALYEDFLGNVYVPAALRARSTDYDRTKMSLQLVLSGLFPPNPDQTWNNNLPWQPIPTTYKPSASDVLLIPEECPQYLIELHRVKHLPEIQAKVARLNGFMANLTQLTGKHMDDTNDLYYLYHSLMAEYSMGLRLPEWVYSIFPEGDLLDGINLEYEITNYNTALKRLNGGVLVRKISLDMVDVRNGKMDPKRKLYLYSGHETNVAALLSALGVYEPHVPQYSSAVIIELMQWGAVYYVRVRYYKGIPAEVEDLLIPGCTMLCPLEKFLKLMRNVTPSDQELYCEKPANLEDLFLDYHDPEVHMVHNDVHLERN
ncbi:venom acid phosphatase Acph-1 isoform X2 [Orussus abietinus]|nr:venom acid phosphatase Acph-1 isoform X2 [Orussus abietinus]XP_012285661.1 venom acid phosphatase Acph-1 isoform X2 [Orussus abietinus]XP_012285662.1 venom acid phosphatase Acph-1 isoform X2 [Orussus abietinus]